MTTQNLLDPNRLLSEAELLLREGLKRIANSAEENLSGAQNPLEEALRLTEEQTMATLAAVERAQDAVITIRNAHNSYIDEPLKHIESALLVILASQQGQDLAGQRLKKAITLLRAVEERIRLTLAEVGMESANNIAEENTATAKANPSINQDEVDSLLAELGI
ncbi:protein phosphatase CheZ [Acidithiobacillus sp. HP-6]|uniref:protein phosphatase CheZ n=1 Tax=unclassified Acidithiobacillus TaxID=2614800 RepID=UPI0018795F98|nr:MULTISPECIES: protein phosphatase CheZ [unclassified Acidithiobacillus]MBE7562842.1 protein phosphatase CheZ [Acidithiobacillus sp. HP-6]MBE7568233.1 protein phosphatase CheZ [Acidithiobacillus sp. HP-2]